MKPNLLLYGDNLPFLSDSTVLPAESVDLIYLDPPFNSSATYNVLFAEVSGQPSAARIKAFDDTWTWDQSAAKALFELLADEHAPSGLTALTTTFQRFLGPSPMFAYLVQMAVRLIHMRRVLKPTGSLYLHCDPTASHYLKLVLDGIFGPENFRSEIVWKRTHAHGAARRYGPIHDTILLYSASDQYVWADPTVPHDPAYIEKHFKQIDPKTGRAYQPITLTGAGTTRGDSGKPWRGVDPTRVKRHWAIPGKVFEKYKLTGRTIQEKLEALDAAGLIYWPKPKKGTPRLKWFIDDLNGAAVSDLWTDIPPISARAAERLGYPTQKPLPLLKRIITASSRPGDLILDPFCGCGTTIDAVETLNREHMDQPPRRWIGIDKSSVAIEFTLARLNRCVPTPAYEFRRTPAGPDAAPRGANAANRRGERHVHASSGLRRKRLVTGERKMPSHV